MGISERKEREREQRRNDIIDAAEKIFFSKGIDNATMDETAEAAELSKGTLYLYFKNKSELLHGIIGRGLELLLNLFRESAEKEMTGIDKISVLGRTYYDFSIRHPEYSSLMMHHEAQVLELDTMNESPNFCRCNETGGKIISLMQEIVEIGVADGTIRNDLDPFKLTMVLWGHTSGLLSLLRAKQQLLEKLYQVDPEELIAFSHQMIKEYLINRENIPDDNKKKTSGTKETKRKKVENKTEE